MMIRLIIDSGITIFVYAKQAMKYSELEKMLKKAGCYYIEPGRGHPLWFSPITGVKFKMSNHRNEEVKPGTLHSIMKAAGIK